ncbi:MAG: hypothetical protein ABW318_04235 [Vicinamibacterales bacterium]
MGDEESAADRRKADCVAKMGPDLAELYDALWNEVAWLHAKWQQFVILFGTSPARVKLLNDAAPGFVRLLQDSLFEDVVLHLARLTDSPATGRKENLSFRRLPDAILDAGTKKRVGGALEVTRTSTAFCRDWRNRRIAHIDLALALRRGADPLQPASREKVRLAVNSLIDVLNIVAQHYLDTTLFFDDFILGNAEQMLYVIDDGLKAGAARRQRIRSGSPLPEDLKPRQL